ncbi:MAG: alanine--glyoxylate aminotransferase family protein [Bacillaceae bacterium]|nr:alanine--glyoxylate aminotransferase family protein [Bacillaceae bacterium]
MLKDKTILQIPGPTPVPPRVQHAMNQPMIGHRSGDFSELHMEVSRRMRPVFGTEQDVYVLTGSGTSALETAVVNTVSAGEEVIVCVTGAFGDRFAKICEKYGITTHRLDVTWGDACTPDLLKDKLTQHPGVKAVFATYCETSTGVLNPVDQLARVTKQHSDALFIVDGVSCIGGVPAEMDNWGIDILVTGSQKAMMLPPGLAFISVSEKAWKVIEENPAPSFYLSLEAYRKNYEKGMTPYTPAISLIYGAQEVLNMMEEEGLDDIFKRHELMKKMTRAGIRALGIPLLADDEYASPTVTAVDPKGAFDPEELRKILRNKYLISVAGGQQHLKGNIFRIGHMGYVNPLDMLTILSALEMALKEIKPEIKLGTAVTAAQEVYAQHV